jgi:hypothetical protein
LRPRRIVAASQRNGRAGGAACAPQLLGELLQSHQRLESLLDGTLGIADDQRPNEAGLVDVDVVGQRRPLRVT